MEIKEYKKRALKALKGRFITLSLMWFVAIIIYSLLTASIIFSGIMINANENNYSIAEKVKEEYVTNIVNETESQEGFFIQGMTSDEKQIIVEKAEKMVNEDEDMSIMIKCAKILDKIRKDRDTMIKVVFIVAVLLFILGIGIISMGLFRAHILVGKMEDIQLRVLFTSVKGVWKMYIIMFITVLATGIGTLLFVIPGIYLQCRLFFAPFVLANDPRKKIGKCLKESWEISKYGRIKSFLILCLSFVGWIIVASCLISLTTKILYIFTLVINAVLYAYMYESITQYYLHNAGLDFSINFENGHE